MFKYAKLLAWVLIGMVAVFMLGIVLVCAGCATPQETKEHVAKNSGEGNSSDSKNNSTAQDQNALKINNTNDNSRNETKIDNRVNFGPLPPVKMPDEPELPEFPNMFLSSAKAIPAACKGGNCQIPQRQEPQTPQQIITTPAPNIKIDLNPVMAQQQERVLAIASDTHRRELEAAEKNYSARLASTEATMRQQIELMKEQANVTNQLAEKRINEKEREIEANAKAKEREIRATEEKWRILAWVIGIGLGACAIVTLLMRSPIDRWKERRQNKG